MGKGNQWVIADNEETVPTYTLAAAFSIALVMGGVVISGVLHKPYEAREVVEELHQRILYEKEMREYRRMSYQPSTMMQTPTVVAEYSEQVGLSESSYAMGQVAPTPVAAPSEAVKTERAERFEQLKRSDDYWAKLQDSVRGSVSVPSSNPVILPPIIIGSAD